MTKKIKWIEVTGSVFLSLLFAALVFAQDIETVNGVRIVHNGKTGRWGKTSKISMELMKTLGDINAEDENIAFYMPGDIIFDAQGNWNILDSGNHRIQKFSPDGKYLATIGRQGQGPGEMSFPASLCLDSSGKLVVSDPNNQRIQVLTPDGKEFKTIRMPQGTIGVVRALSSGRLVMGGTAGFVIMGMGEESKNKELPKLMKIIDLDGHILKEFGDQHDYKHLLLNRMGNQVLFTVDSQDNIYLAFPFQNRIEKYSSEGELLWRADRKLDYSMAPPKNKGKREASGGNVRIQAPQMNRCSNGIAVDGQGRIWVITLTRQIKDDEKVNQMISVQMANGKRSMNMKLKGNTDIENTDMYKIQIFAPDGVLLGEIPLQHFADGITIKNDKVFLVDKLRGTKYYEYKISQ